MGEIKFITSIVLATLFAIAVIGYAVNFSYDNDTPVSLNDDATMNSLSGKLVGNMEEINAKVNESSSGFFSSEADANNDMTTTGGQFKVGASTFVTTFRTLIEAIKVKLFGNNTGLMVFVNGLLIVLTFMLVRYIYKTWKGGNPD